jgi:phosphohistidine phosphatase
MLVILLRHGPAGEADPDVWPDDSKRPLTARGRERTQQAAAGIQRILEDQVRVVLTSPFVRCAETAKIAADVLDVKKLDTLDALAPGGSFRKVIQAIPSSRASEAVVIVGHEPDLGRLAGMFVSTPQLALPLRKAGACAIRFDAAVVQGKGRLEWHLPPRILRRLAGRKALT